MATNQPTADMFRSLRKNGTEPLIVQQCKYLEQAYNTNFTQVILADNDTPICSIFEALEEADKELTWSLVSESSSLKLLANVIPWLKLWDIARDRGIQGARSLQAIIKVLTAPVFADTTCQFCNVGINEGTHYSDHVMQTHLSTSVDNIVRLLKEESDDIFPIGLKLMELFNGATTLSLPCTTVL